MNVERKNSLIWLSLVFIGLLSSQYYVLINNKYHLAWWGLMLIDTGLIIALKQIFEIHHKRLSSIMIIIYWLLAIISWTGFNFTLSISAGIIMTVNIGDLTKFTTDFYSVQYFGTTLPFLAQAKRTQRPVYVWTAKRKLTMAILNSLAIAGQISDYGAQNRYLTKDYRLNRVALLINTGINYL